MTCLKPLYNFQTSFRALLSNTWFWINKMLGDLTFLVPLVLNKQLCFALLLGIILLKMPQIRWKVISNKIQNTPQTVACLITTICLTRVILLIERVVWFCEWWCMLTSEGYFNVTWRKTCLEVENSHTEMWTLTNNRKPHVCEPIWASLMCIHKLTISSLVAHTTSKIKIES